MNKQILYLSTLLFVSTLLVQCKAKKPLIDAESVRVYNLSKNQADTIVKKVLNNNFEFTNLKAKINTRFKSREKKNVAFGTFIKMHKDSVIHVTISKVVPIITALITPDSIKFFNKLDQKYFEGNFSYVSQLLKTKITFGQIQDLLIGNPIRMDSISNHYLIQDNEEFYISSLSQSQLNKMESNGNWNVKFWINELFKAGKTIVSNDSTNTRIEIFQADYKKIDGKLFPNRTKAEIITEKDSISIHLNYQRVKINTNIEYDFSIPSHYTEYE